MLFRRRSEKIDVLRKVPLFSDFNNRQLNVIAKHADEVTLDAGKVLARQGEYGLEFICIVGGSARVENDGKLINRLSPGDFFGEISLLDGGPRTATVMAEKQVHLLVMHKKSFDHLLDTVPGLQRKLLLTLCKYLRRKGF